MTAGPLQGECNNVIRAKPICPGVLLKEGVEQDEEKDCKSFTGVPKGILMWKQWHV